MATNKKADAPETDESTPDTFVDADRSITLADVAALQGVALAPDASTSDVVMHGDAAGRGVFISEGMRVDLLQQGWARDPITGKVIITEDAKRRVEEARAAKESSKK